MAAPVPLREATIVDDTAQEELTLLTGTMGAVMVVYALVDAAAHGRAQMPWHLAVSLAPAVALAPVWLASWRGRVPSRWAGWATALAIGLMATSILNTALLSHSLADVTYLCVLMVVSGAAAMRTVPFVTILLVVLGAASHAASTLPAESGTPMSLDWVAVLAVTALASSVVHVARVRGLLHIGRTQDALEQQATVDVLSGVHTRYGMQVAFPLVRAQASRNKVPVFAVFVDVDGLKRVNDTLGHDAGDELIVFAADALTRATRSTDAIARWGGDEFVVFGAGELPPLDRLQRSVDGYLASVWSRPEFPAPTISLGVAITTAADADLDGLIGRADADMYERRRARRGVASPPHN